MIIALCDVCAVGLYHFRLQRKLNVHKLPHIFVPKNMGELMHIFVHCRMHTFYLISLVTDGLSQL